MVVMKVKSIDPGVRERIKMLAKQSGLSVGEFLNVQYGGEVPKSKNESESWHINVAPEDRTKIKEGAAKKNMSIGRYLTYLVDSQDNSKLIKNIQEYINKCLENYK